MRKLLLIFVLLAGSQCYGAVAHVAAGQGFCNASSFGGSIGSICGAPIATKTFTYTPTGTGNALLLSLGCGANSATPSAVTLTATSWTITQLVPSGGAASGIAGSTTNGFQAVFKAYALNTSATTFTITWTGAGANGCNSFMNALVDEFSGMDATNFVDNNSATGNSATGAAGCSLSITPASNNDGIWFACNDTITAVSAGWTKGADDTVKDWTEWQILAGGSGVAKAAGFTSSGTMTIFGVAIKPASGAVTDVGVSKWDKLQKYGIDE